METTTASSNFELFLKTPNGIEAAVRVNVEDIDSEGEAQPKLARLVGYMARLDKQLADANFQRSERLDKPARGGGGRPSPPATDASGNEVKCPKCGGAMWDNKPKKASGEFSPTSPDYKCRDKNCGGVIWPPK